MSETLLNHWNDALLFRTLATLRLDVPVFDSIDDLCWPGLPSSFKEYCDRLKSPQLLRRAEATSTTSKS